jgi:hypothetical protein
MLYGFNIICFIKKSKKIGGEKSWKSAEFAVPMYLSNHVLQKMEHAIRATRN